jgi:hypothetical protein
LCRSAGECEECSIISGTGGAGIFAVVVVACGVGVFWFVCFFAFSLLRFGFLRFRLVVVY